MANKPISPRRGQEFSKDGTPTLRMSEWMENITDESKSSAAAVESQSTLSLLAALLDLQKIVGSGQFLTTDCDSLTIDSTFESIDMTEA